MLISSSNCECSQSFYHIYDKQDNIFANQIFNYDLLNPEGESQDAPELIHYRG